jgi:hypothetical protein
VPVLADQEPEELAQMQRQQLLLPPLVSAVSAAFTRFSKRPKWAALPRLQQRLLRHQVLRQVLHPLLQEIQNEETEIEKGIVSGNVTEWNDPQNATEKGLNNFTPIEHPLTFS